MMLRVTTLLLFLFLAAVLSPPAAAESRTALVIGNGAYRSAPLANPTNDARDVAGALRDVGFEVTVHTDLGQKAMKKAILAFGRQLRKRGGVGLFYYAGHAMQVNGENYLIPSVPRCRPRRRWTSNPCACTR